jgi:hypothetical protein
MTVVFDIFDESQRSRAPLFQVTPAQRMHGRRLARIHELHLRQIAQVEALIVLIDNALAKQQEAADAMSALDMSRNYKAFGGLCYQESQFLDFHHTSEDEAIFPALRGGNAGLDAVLDRLAEEHVAIHGWIERLVEMAVNFHERPGPTGYEQLRTTFQTLAGLVKSYFGYEQGELEEALGLFDAPL